MKILGGNVMLHVEVRGQRFYVYVKRLDIGWHVRCTGLDKERFAGYHQTWAAAYRAGLRLAAKMAPRRK